MTGVRVEQTIDLPAKQYVVVSTAHPDFDLLSGTEMLSFVGKLARFKNESNIEFILSILDISYSSSLTDRKNVFFAFPLNAKEKIILNSTFDIIE